MGIVAGSRYNSTPWDLTQPNRYRCMTHSVTHALSGLERGTTSNCIRMWYQPIFFAYAIVSAQSRTSNIICKVSPRGSGRKRNGKQETHEKAHTPFTDLDTTASSHLWCHAFERC